MIDIHNHVLPKLDDGSKSIDMSIDMLELAENQGITEVVSTVHYQHPKFDNLRITYEKMLERIYILEKHLDKKSIGIKIHPGAEVYYYPNLLQLIENPLTTMGNGKYMLVEFHPHHIPEGHKNELFNLKMSGVTPIIAHPERYKIIQNDINKVLEWMDIGCLIQVDAGSVLGTLGKAAQIASEVIIKNRWCQILCSDAHDNRNRNFNLKDAVELIENWVGKNAYSLVYDNPKAVLSGEKVKIDPNDNIYPKENNVWKKIMLKISKLK